jgi:uncharacterized protein YecE (DUF72 family)
MKIHAGTSGFSYDEWRGTFYPDDLPKNGMLGHYSARLGSVEINNTFYQLPKAELLERWRDAVPPDFTFALKAARRITHIQRLKGSVESVGYFFGAAAVLGERLGPVLFQLPPFAQKDTGLLREFLSVPPAGARIAFEFRHPTWFDDEVYALLHERNAALCGGDSDEGDRSPPLVATADWGYLRLRSPAYDAAGIARWCERIVGEPWQTAYVYFKHEVFGPAYALHLGALARGEAPPDLPATSAPAAAASAKPAPRKRGKTSAESARDASDAGAVTPKPAQKRAPAKRQRR